MQQRVLPDTVPALVWTDTGREQHCVLTLERPAAQACHRHTDVYDIHLVTAGATVTGTVTATAGVCHTPPPPGLRHLTSLLGPALEPGIVLTSQDPEAPKPDDSPGSVKLLKEWPGWTPHTRLPILRVMPYHRPV